MNKYKPYFLLMLISLLQVACKQSSKNSENIKEAIRIHLEAIDIGNQAKIMLDTIGLENDYRKVLMQKVEQWEASAIEIEGMEDDHDHGHGHKNTALHLTDLEMIDVQKVWKDTISMIVKEIYNENIN